LEILIGQSLFILVNRN